MNLKKLRLSDSYQDSKNQEILQTPSFLNLSYIPLDDSQNIQNTLSWGLTSFKLIIGGGYWSYLVNDIPEGYVTNNDILRGSVLLIILS